MRKRLPFTGVYNTRPGSLSFGTSSAICDIAICDLAICDSVTFSSTKDTRFVNCYPITQSDEIANSKSLQIVKRFGYASHSTPASGSMGNAIAVWTEESNKVMTCFGNTNSTLYDATTSKGTITGLARGIEETEVSSTPTLLIASSDGSGWYYQDGGSVTEITDGDFPSNSVGNFVAMNGFAYIMDADGKVYNSDLNSVTAWTANSYFDTNSIPDSGVGLARSKDVILAFCKDHTEVLYQPIDTPATGTPLVRSNERTINIGCASSDAIARLRDTIYFAGTTEGSNVCVYSYEAGNVGKISSPEIDAKLTFAGPANITLTVVGENGRHFVVVCATTATYRYCIEEKHWHECSGLQVHKAAGVSTGSTVVTYAISKNSTLGKVFVLNPLSPTYQDNGSTFTATIQTPKLDFGVASKKTWKELYVIADQETTTSSLSIAWYDDDYQTLSSSKTVDLSSNVPRIIGGLGGMSRRRSFVFTHAANTPMRLEGVEVVFDVASL